MNPLYKKPKAMSIFKSALAVWFTVTTVMPACAGNAPTELDLKKWGALTAPVYGTSETGVYAGAELFAGPNKFGSYFAGVIPNGSIVKPAGTTVQVGMNPLGSVLTPDHKFLITTNDDEREVGYSSYQSAANVGGYSISVLDANTMKVVSTITKINGAAFKVFIGLAAANNGSNGYTLWASGGADSDVKVFNISATGIISQDPTTPKIPIAPITDPGKGYVSNYYTNASYWGGKPTPSGFSTSGAHITFPAGCTLSPDGKYLYVACNGDDSVAVIDTGSKTVVKQVPVGYFPYGVSVTPDGAKVAVSNWGVTEYKFANPTYDNSNPPMLTALGTTGTDLPDGFFVPVQSTTGNNPQSSSVSILSAPGGDGSKLALMNSIFEGTDLDMVDQVGETHPSATAIVHQGGQNILFVAKANVDSLGVINLNDNTKLPDFNLSPIKTDNSNKNQIPLYGTYPNAIVVSADNNRMYVAEAGINSVAVLDTSNPLKPQLLGRIKTNWYPTGLALSNDGRYLYIANAKGIGEDINPNIVVSPVGLPTGLGSDPSVDSNYIFGTAQKVDLKTVELSNDAVLDNNFAKHENLDTSVVPMGDGPSKKIKHVIFILHENKTVDSVLGNLAHLGPFGSLAYNNKDGSSYTNNQFTGVTLNLQNLASTFALAINSYSDSEESDAGHQFCASGTATDYTEKTLLVKSGRGLLVNKNFEPEDYPAGGYIFNNCARNGVSFKDYGAMVRIDGTDTGVNPVLDDPNSGLLGYPFVNPDGTVSDTMLGDVTSPTSGLGQSYFLSLPVLAILGTNNANNEPRLDQNYPGYNFNISDQRRAQEFITDFDRMVKAGTLPQFLYIYQPNDHTGSVQAANASSVVTNPPMLAQQQVADNDVALGMVVQHIMQSPIYYNQKTGEGCAIFITEDDAQSSLDHIHPHRTPVTVVSPYAKPGHLAKRHYCTASIVKTEELLLGLPPMNLGDLFATDLRDLFQPTYNQITASMVPWNKKIDPATSAEEQKVWSLVSQLNTAEPDEDSLRLGILDRMTMQAGDLHKAAAQNGQLNSQDYLDQQNDLYQAALQLVNSGGPTGDD